MLNASDVIQPSEDIMPDPEVDTVLSEETLKLSLNAADQLKQEGNDFFRSNMWNDALVTYRNALTNLPARKMPPDKGKSKASDLQAPSNFQDEDHKTSELTPPQHQSALSPSGLDEECAKARAVLHANIGACHVKLGQHADAVKACSEALLDDPFHSKAMNRRAQCNYHIGTWASLVSAKEDYTSLLRILPSSSSQVRDIRNSLEALEPRLEAAQKKEMGETMDKLKGLGNSVLGMFGLSTDNFRFEPSGQGSYSLNFTR